MQGAGDNDELDVAWEDEAALQAEMEAQEAYELSPAGIADQNAGLLRRYRELRQAADAVAKALARRRDVMRIALYGDVAREPWKEVPRFSTYRRARIELWHEAQVAELALWLDALGDLNAVRKAKNAVLRQLFETGGPSVASHQVGAVILEAGTDRYLGGLCEFNTCPKHKQPCLVEGCGETPFLQQFEERYFFWNPRWLDPDRSLVLFDRSSGVRGRAVDLPLPTESRG